MSEKLAAVVEPDEEALYWLALKLAPGLGTRLAAPLVETFGHPREIFQASPTELKAKGIPAQVAQNLGSGAAFKAAAQEAARVAQLGYELVTFLDPRFPPALK